MRLKSKNEVDFLFITIKQLIVSASHFVAKKVMKVLNSLSVKMMPTPEAEGSLNAIIKYSLFNSKEKLLEEFGALEEFRCGTRIIIYNLKR